MPIAMIISFFTGPMGKLAIALIVIASIATSSFYKGYSSASDHYKSLEATQLIKAQEEASKHAKEDNDAAIAAQARMNDYKASNDLLENKLAALIASRKHNPVCDDKESEDALNVIIRNSHIRK